MTETLTGWAAQSHIYRQGTTHSAKWPVDLSLDPHLRYIGTQGGLDHLNIGSGVNPLPGAINVDQQDFPGVNAHFDFTQRWPVADAAVDLVTFFHCLEHVEPVVALQVLQEAYRVLRDGGRVIAEVPDIAGACAQLIAGNYGMLAGAIYGGHDAPEDEHRYGYTASSLALLGHLAGFVRLVTKPGTDYHAAQMPTVRVEAVKVRRREKAAPA